MLIISLFAHVQHCVERYQTRKALVKVTEQEMKDMGLTDDVRRAELSQANLIGFIHDLTRLGAKRGL